MTGLAPVLLLGAVLGARHATDADHVVAVTAIVTRQRRLRDAIRVGALWGIGHTATLALFGGAIIALGLVVPPRLGLALEFVVALGRKSGPIRLWPGGRWPGFRWRRPVPGQRPGRPARSRTPPR